jgi:hypothetical protein
MLVRKQKERAEQKLAQRGAKKAAENKFLISRFSVTKGRAPRELVMVLLLGSSPGHRYT